MSEKKDYLATYLHKVAANMEALKDATSKASHRKAPMDNLGSVLGGAGVAEMFKKYPNTLKGEKPVAEPTSEKDRYWDSVKNKKSTFTNMEDKDAYWARVSPETSTTSWRAGDDVPPPSNYRETFAGFSKNDPSNPMSSLRFRDLARYGLPGGSNIRVITENAGEKTENTEGYRPESRASLYDPGVKTIGDRRTLDLLNSYNALRSNPDTSPEQALEEMVKVHGIDRRDVERFRDTYLKTGIITAQNKGKAGGYTA